MTDIIRVQDAWYEYERADDEGELAVRGVSLSVRKGEWLSIIGRNGSGKSTLIKLAQRPVPAHLAASVTVGGYDTRGRGAHLGRAPAGRHGLPEPGQPDRGHRRRGGRGLRPGEPRRAARRRSASRVDEALRAVGMQEYAASAPHMLSGGQKQRVAIAGALAMRAGGACVLDEPTAMLDPCGRREVMATVERAQPRERHDGGAGSRTSWTRPLRGRTACIAMHDGKVDRWRARRARSLPARRRRSRPRAWTVPGHGASLPAPARARPGRARTP